MPAMIPDFDISAYSPPFALGNGHVQSVFPTLFRRVALPPYERERIALPDGDFLDVDWLRGGHARAAVISHGLGGHSNRWYVKGLARALFAAGWDVAAWNFRGCGGEINARPVFTHSGSSGDLDAVVRSVRGKGVYERIGLAGFSMGGNITLLYLGRAGDALFPEVCGAAAISAPCDLAGAAAAIARPGNRIYLKRFLLQLREHVAAMSEKFPDVFSLEGYEEIVDFAGFDGRYTAPLHGYRDARDYWTQNSSRALVHAIRRPAWIVNAWNDPFLTPSCFPEAEAAANPWVRLIASESGGHCGFIAFNRERRYWSETFVCLALEAAARRQG